MKIKYLLIALVGLLTFSCSSIKRTASTAVVETKVVNYTVADMEVSPTKASVTYNWNYNPFKVVNIELVKANLRAQLLNENGGDVLVEPQYIVEKRGLWRGGSVTVIGFPAKYTKFRNMNEGELQTLIQSGIVGPCTVIPCQH